MNANRFSLHPHVFIKLLEKPCIYNRKSDELYELDKRGFNFLRKIIGGSAILNTPEKKKFLKFLLREKLVIKTGDGNSEIPYGYGFPSLRYLELQLTKKCNLKCRHCYLGRAENIELPLEKAIEIVKNFEYMQGLKLLVSGGEPLLYSKFYEFNRFLKEIKVRRVLITNGIPLSKIDCASLNFDEVQVSVDGLGEAHDKVRGEGAYQKTMEGVKNLKKTDIDMSVATMVTAYNLNDFEVMQKIFKKLRIKSWGIDMPCVSGYLKENPDIIPPIGVAAKLMKYAFGGGYHNSNGSFICGNHLLTVSPDGNVAKCGFYLDKPYGNIFKEPLSVIWKRAQHIPVFTIKECRNCKFINSCLGGCRFRADSPEGRDRVMCYFYNSMGTN